MAQGHDTQILKGVLSMLLLRLLDIQEDYGYSVVVRLHNSGFDHLTEGTVYPALTRLESKGLLSSRLVPSPSGPARKYYQLTPEGLIELDRSSTAWADLSSNVERAMSSGSPTPEQTPITQKEAADV